MRKTRKLLGVLLALLILVMPLSCVTVMAQEPTMTGELLLANNSGDGTVSLINGSGSPYTISLKNNASVNSAMAGNKYYTGTVYLDGVATTVRFKYESVTNFVGYNVALTSEMVILPETVFTSEDGTCALTVTRGLAYVNNNGTWLRHYCSYYENDSTSTYNTNFHIYSSTQTFTNTSRRYNAEVLLDGVAETVPFKPQNTSDKGDMIPNAGAGVSSSAEYVSIPAGTFFKTNQTGNTTDAFAWLVLRNDLLYKNVDGTLRQISRVDWNKEGFASCNLGGNGNYHLYLTDPAVDFGTAWEAYTGTIVVDGVEQSNHTIQTNNHSIIINTIPADAQTVSIPADTVLTRVVSSALRKEIKFENTVTMEKTEDGWRVPATVVEVTDTIGVINGNQFQFLTDGTVQGWYNGTVNINGENKTVRFHLGTQQAGSVIGQKNLTPADAFVAALESNSGTIKISADTALTLAAGEGDVHPENVRLVFDGDLYLTFKDGAWVVSDTEPLDTLKVTYVNIASSNQVQFTTNSDHSNYGWYEAFVDIDGVSKKVRVSMGSAGSQWCVFGQNGLNPADGIVDAVQNGKTIHVPKIVELTAIQDQPNATLNIEFSKEFWLVCENGVYTMTEEKPATVIEAAYGDMPASNQIRYYFSGHYSNFWCSGIANIDGVDETVGFYLSVNWGVVGNNDAMVAAVQQKKNIKLYRQTEIVNNTDANDKYILDFGSDVYLTYLEATGEWVMTTTPISQIIEVTTIVGGERTVATVPTGETYRLPDLPAGYAGWKVGENYYDAGEEFVVSGDIVLCAYTLMLGDVNDDATVDVRDLIRLKKYLAQTANDINEINADADENGVINAVDCSALSGIILSDSVKIYDLPTFDSSVEMDLAAYSGPRRAGYRYYEGEYGDHPDDPYGGYVSHITSADFDEYMQAGFTYLITENDAYYDYDPTTNSWISDYGTMTASLKQYMDLAESKNIPVLVSCQLMNRMLRATTLNSTANMQRIKTMTATLSRYSCFKGYLAGDELSVTDSSSETGNRTVNIAELYAQIKAAVREVNPDAILYTSQLPTYGFDSLEEYAAYVETFSDAADAFVYDFYPLISTDYATVAGGGTNTAVRENWFTNLEIVAQSAKESNYDAGIVIQAYASTNPEKQSTFFKNYTYLRSPENAADISFQAYTALAYGMKSISYYRYMQSWSESDSNRCVASMVRYADESDANSAIEKTAVYYAVQTVNKEIKSFDQALMNYNWQGTMAVCANGTAKSALLSEVGNYSADRIQSVVATNEAVIGCLKDAENRDAFVVVNATDPAKKIGETVAVHFNDATLAVVYMGGHKHIVRLTNGMLELNLASGQGAVVLPVQ